MAYQTPKTDWAAPDGVAASDMNRMEGNAVALKEAVDRIATGIAITIPITGWTSVSINSKPFYYLTIADASIVATDRVDINLAVESLEYATACQLQSATVAVTGGVTIYAKFVPTTVMAGNMYITKVVA